MGIFYIFYSKYDRKLELIRGIELRNNVDKDNKFVDKFSKIGKEGRK